MCLVREGIIENEMTQTETAMYSKHQSVDKHNKTVDSNLLRFELCRPSLSSSV